MTIEISESAGVRSLHFGTPWIQGSMRIARPWALELEYTRDMLLPLLLHPVGTWPRSVLMIGLGAGALLKFLHRHVPACTLTAVEIDQAVIVAAQQHFRVPSADPRVRIVCGDAFEWIGSDRERYDLILADGFDLNARAHRLESAAFYGACKARLAEVGWLSCNLLTLHRSHAATRRALHSVFDSGLSMLPACAEGNVVAVASAGAAFAAEGWRDFPALREAARGLRRQTGLNLLPLLSRIEQA